MNNVISIDPGTAKCGLLVADTTNKIVLSSHVLEKDLVLGMINEWCEKYSIRFILIGNGTNSRYWHSVLQSLNQVPLILVEEKGTTLRARYRYWELHPPRFLKSLIPKGLLFPPKELDSIAPLVLLEDYFNEKFTFLIE